MTISNRDIIINTRDIYARIEEIHNDTGDQYETCQDELETLERLRDDLPNARPTLLVRENFFLAYTEDTMGYAYVDFDGIGYRVWTGRLYA